VSDITGPKVEVLVFKKPFLKAQTDGQMKALDQKGDALAKQESEIRKQLNAMPEGRIREKERVIAIKQEAVRDPSGFRPEHRGMFMNILRKEIDTLDLEIGELRQQQASGEPILEKQLQSLDKDIAEKERLIAIKKGGLADVRKISPSFQSTYVGILNREIKTLETEVTEAKEQKFEAIGSKLKGVLLNKQLDVVEAGKAEIDMYRQILSKRPFLALTQLDASTHNALIGADKLPEEQASALVGKTNTMVDGLPPQVQIWLYQTDPKSRAKDLIEPMLKARDIKLISLLIHNLCADPPQACRMGLNQLVSTRLKAPDLSSEISDRLGAIRKRAEALKTKLEEARKAAVAADVPKDWCKRLTGEYKEFLTSLYCDTASEVGLDHYTLLGVGSMARDEMLPYSDIDYQAILDRKIDLYVYHAMEKIKEVEDYCNAILDYINEPKLDEMERPETVAGFFPEALAEAHAKKKMDIIQDAIELASMSEIKLSRDTKRPTTPTPSPGIEDVDEPGSLPKQYFDSIKEIMGDKDARVASILPFIDAEADKFHPTKSNYMFKAKKDIKKGLLRLPIFCIRNLIFYYGIADAPKDLAGRCDALQKGGFIDPSITQAVLFVADFALNTRRKLHAKYGKECEDFVRIKDKDAKDAVGVYVLDAQEDEAAEKCIKINEELYNRMKQITKGCFLTFELLGSWKIDRRMPGGRLIECSAANPPPQVEKANCTVNIGGDAVAANQVNKTYAIARGDSVTKLEMKRPEDNGLILVVVDQDLVNGQLKIDGKTIMLTTGGDRKPFQTPLTI
jgi:hypothetical protein